MAAPGIIVVKTFNYRGAAEEWSNGYHMTLAPSTPAGWRTAADGLIAEESSVYSSRVTVVRALCYADTAGILTYDYDLGAFGGTVSGTLSTSAGDQTPGDTAGWVRWDTGRRSSRGKPIYLRKYFHDVQVDVAPNADTIAPDQRTVYSNFGTTLLSALGGGFALAGPDGVQPPGPSLAATFATTRTLERRGRRP